MSPLPGGESKKQVPSQFRGDLGIAVPPLPLYRRMPGHFHRFSLISKKFVYKYAVLHECKPFVYPCSPCILSRLHHTRQGSNHTDSTDGP